MFVCVCGGKHLRVLNRWGAGRDQLLIILLQTGAEVRAELLAIDLLVPGFQRCVDIQGPNRAILLLTNHCFPVFGDL